MLSTDTPLFTHILRCGVRAAGTRSPVIPAPGFSGTPGKPVPMRGGIDALCPGIDPCAHKPVSTHPRTCFSGTQANPRRACGIGTLSHGDRVHRPQAATKPHGHLDIPRAISPGVKPVKRWAAAYSQAVDLSSGSPNYTPASYHESSRLSRLIFG